MDTGSKQGGRERTARDSTKPRANTPQGETEAARRSGQFGADKPGFGEPPPRPGRTADKKHNDKGPEYEEGGQYPGKRPGGK